jgi:hypothetical protein
VSKSSSGSGERTGESLTGRDSGERISALRWVLKEAGRIGVGR